MAWTYRPDLDGIRCIAVYLVLLFHAGLGAVGGGFIGVDLFFVLSGFLVSSIILSEIDATGRLSFSRFYARRVRRLLPAAVVVIVATSLMTVLVAPLVRRLPLVADAQSALLYVANWHFLGQLNDYFATGTDESPFLHFWSLAIEEQFYVAFPVLLVLLSKLSRRRSWALPAVLVVVFLLSLGAQVYWAGADPNRAYYGTDARLYQLLAGAILAVLVRGRRRRSGHAGHRRSSVRVPHLAGVVGLAALLVLGSGLLDLTPSWRGVAATGASVLLVGGVVAAPDRGLRHLLSRRTPVYLGKISYGTYLWHWPVILVLQELLAASPLAVAAVATALSTGLAALSSEVLEMPVRTAKALNHLNWPSVTAGLTTSTLVAVTVVPAVLESERRPALVQTMPVGASSPVSSESGSSTGWGAAAGPGSSGGAGTSGDAGAAPGPDREGSGSTGGSRAEAASGATDPTTPTSAERHAPVPDDIDWRGILDDKGPMPDCSVDDPQSCVVVEGDGPHVLLVGDSHARMLGSMFIRLAEEHDLTLSMNVRPACPWQAGVVNLKQPMASQERCRDLRDRWYREALPKLDPDLVVLSQMGRDSAQRWQGRLQRDGGTKEERLADLSLAATLDTVDTLVRTGTRVLVVDTLVDAGFDPLECLSLARRLDQCEVPLRDVEPASDAYYRTAAERFDDVFTVDLNEVMCVGPPRCLPVVDGIVVWKNTDHLTTTYATHRRAEVWDAIEATGALDGL